MRIKTEPEPPQYRVFVLMPFSATSADRYELAVKAACQELGLICERVEEQTFQESIPDRIFEEILKADIIVSDLTERNPNVFFETGYAKALGKRIIFITNKAEELPFDLRIYPSITYGISLTNLKRELRKKLEFYLREDRARNFRLDSNQISGGTLDSKAWLRLGGADLLAGLFPRTEVYSNQDLVQRLETARSHIVAFGLTRNFYVSDRMYDLFKRKAQQLPVRIYLMDPECSSRQDRYRVEPMEAALEDPVKFKLAMESKFLGLLAEVNAPGVCAEGAGLEVYYYNFPCSFAIEYIDDVCRVMLYGHGKRGTDGPIFVFRRGNPYFEYFKSQLDWLERLAQAKDPYWISRNLVVRKLELRPPTRGAPRPSRSR